MPSNCLLCVYTSVFFSVRGITTNTKTEVAQKQLISVTFILFLLFYVFCNQSEAFSSCLATTLKVTFIVIRVPFHGREKWKTICLVTPFLQFPYSWGNVVYVNIPKTFASFTVTVSNIPLFTDWITIVIYFFWFISLVNVQSEVFLAVPPCSLAAEYERVWSKSLSPCLCKPCCVSTFITSALVT
jgi:hypothetical protein